jgi:hypothetical protein
MSGSLAAALIGAYLIYSASTGQLGQLMQILGLAANANSVSGPGADTGNGGG